MFGSNQFGGNHRTSKEAWEMFRTEVPLTGAEFARIPLNVAPYLNGLASLETSKCFCPWILFELRGLKSKRAAVYA